MVVDDSALYRQMVKNVLRDVPGVEVVALAKTGAEAISLLTEYAPHLLTLDVQMPDMNGLEVLRELKKMRSSVKAIMLSSLTAQGAKVTTDALLAGAFDFIQKPNSQDANANRDLLRISLIEKVSAFRESMDVKMPRRQELAVAEQLAAIEKSVRVSGARASESLVSRPSEGRDPTSRFGFSVKQNQSRGRIEAVVIGTSTGGPVALREVLPKLPSTLNVPIFVVQHMPARYTKSLSERIAEVSMIPIHEASDGMKIEANHVYIAPGGLHMRLCKSSKGLTIQTNEEPPEHNCRPAVDYTFRSAAEIYGMNLLAVVLTGMGRDGTEGCRVIKQRGGLVIAQHPEGCVVYGMPKAVVEEQLADRVVPLEKIASWIVRLVESKE